MKKIVLFVLAGALTLSTLEAQITLTAQDFLQFLSSGNAFIVTRADTIRSAYVGFASSSAQTFDLTNIAYSVPVESLAMVLPQNTPYADSFPNANIAEEQFDTISKKPIYYLYYQLLDSSLVEDGYTFLTGSPRRYFPPELNDRFPLALGTQWTYIAKPDTQWNGIINRDTLYYLYDAYGTIKLPGGSYPCLRIKKIEGTESDSGIISILSDRSYSYIFLTKEGTTIRVGINGTDTNLASMQNAGIEVLRHVSVIANINKPIAPLPENISFQIYPVPVTSTDNDLTVAYNLPTTSAADIALLNILGQPVARISTGLQAAGYHTLAITAQNIPAGTYFCKMSTGMQIAIQPILVEH